MFKFALIEDYYTCRMFISISNTYIFYIKLFINLFIYLFIIYVNRFGEWDPFFFRSDVPVNEAHISNSVFCYSLVRFHHSQTANV